jgi:ribosome-associated heat shock protein Hsp15
MVVRLDKWLWAARFFKTRSIATQSVAGGKVHCNGKRVKPAKEVQIGDELRIHKGAYEFIIVVLDLNDKRRPAKEAALLYEETDESIAAREKVRGEKKILRLGAEQFGPVKKPGKRDRRLIRSFTRQD